MNMECEHGSCGCHMHQEQEQPTVKYDYSVAVRFKNATKPYSFGCDTADIKKGSWVVVETAQGIVIFHCRLFLFLMHRTTA